MSFTLPELPYDRNALEPYISAETLEFHHGKHHNAYVTNLNKLIAGTPRENKPLEDIIVDSEGGVFNNAAQVWNHTLYWNSLKPGGGSEPSGPLGEAIKRDFGSFGSFKEAFATAAATLFGSGWAWLVLDGGKLQVTKTANADLPMKHGQTALLTIDVWEHAYYVDYRNARPKYIDTVIANLLNWDFAATNFEKADTGLGAMTSCRCEASPRFATGLSARPFRAHTQQVGELALARIDGLNRADRAFLRSRPSGSSIGRASQSVAGGRHRSTFIVRVSKAT